MSRFGRWYIPRREARYIRRNALIVLGNVADADEDDVRAALETFLSDPDPMLRAHAVWAAKRLGLESMIPATDPDPGVAAELERPVPSR